MSKLLEAIDAEKIKEKWNLELLLIDDGSKDGSFLKILELKKSYHYIRGFRLARNFGHQSAVSLGLKEATGDYIAIIDDDLQDPPSLLPQFFAKLDAGYDVVYGVRKKRKENFFKVLAYNAFYRILKRLSEIEIPLDSGDFCVMKKCVVQNMLTLHERNPFLRGIRSWVGFKQIGLEYERQARLEGESGYTLKKLFKIAADGIFSFSNLPLRFITFVGLIGLSFSVVYSIYILSKLLFYGIGVEGFVTIVIMIMFFGSINLLCMGILGEYLARIYAEGKNRPHYVLAETC
jgi:glycosyltransferase involved in cell wall biosynthesis